MLTTAKAGPLGLTSHENRAPPRWWRRVQETYALGGGRSGAEPDDDGIVTVSTVTLRSDTTPAIATPSACDAPSAVTHGMEAIQEPCTGLEHGAWPDEPSSLELPSSPGAPTVAIGAAMFVISAIETVAVGEPVMAAIPGVVHTAPLLTIVR